jgi:hypothetical protein
MYQKRKKERIKAELYNKHVQSTYACVYTDVWNKGGNRRFSIYQESPVDLSRQHRIRRKEEEEA